MAQAKRRKAAGRPKSAAREPAGDLDGRAIEAAMRLAVERGWRNVTLAAVAADCGVTLAELYRRYPSCAAILAGLARQVDAAVLGGPPADAEESPRDRLFDTMMRRYDALKPHREAIARIVADAPGDPLALLCLCGQARRSMAWMLEAAGIPSGGLAGALKAKGLGLVHLSVLRVWLNDDSDDQAKTMAALDTALRRIEPIARSLFRTETRD
ncbi:MAG: helix-turn-helix transcriptional regulator [Alphaproteobacteria bacterium]|nr:helix-turn-helix transcriptional regulator [Alphaproteobacteria bacterium]